MKTVLLVSIVGIALLVSGCSTTNLSMNYQKSLSRCAGDVSATITLQQTDKVDAAKIIEVANIIKKYIEEHPLDNITRDQLIVLLSDKIPYAPLKNMAFSIVNRLPADIDVKACKKLIIAYCDGLITGATGFDPNDKSILGQ